ncbi:MAG: hypothetical protein GEV10_12535 [Streptosporangiales bacterium]|nr:hypothetical protein [Streptosporangiales bacterium]
MSQQEPYPPAPIGNITVVAAKPVTIPIARLVVGMILVLSFDVMIGVALEWWMGAILVALTLVQLPFLKRVVAKRAARLPDRLEVRADRISAVVGQRGDGSELTRVDGHLLAVRDLNGEPHLYVVGPGGDNGSIALGRFDVEKVGEAALAHGWPWQPPGSSAVIQPPTAAEPSLATAPAPAGHEIMVRDGRTRTVPSKPVLTTVVLLALVAVFTLVGAAVTFGTPGWVSATAVVVAILLLVGALVGGSFLMVRLSRATVTVDRDRLAVKYGSLSASTVQRSSIASGQAGRRWVRLRDHHGKQLVWVPLRPKRDEVLTALRSYGWPVDDVETRV